MTALYIHIPFCAKKCRYCDFVSFDSSGNRMDGYFKALKKEIELSTELYSIKGVSSVFFGGGTPSFVDERYITDILEAVCGQMEIRRGAEITLEANPNSLSPQKLQAYRRAGVNRLSIGLQSADDKLLARIGRLHTKEMFEKAFWAAREEGFENINIDLIYALPGQKTANFMETLDFVSGLIPEHVSAYALTLSEGTPLYRDIEKGVFQAVDEEEDRAMYHTAVAVLKSRGYARYEISNFAKEGYECRHNLAYWKRKDYLGIGLAAHSCITDVRFSNTSDLKTYISCLSKGKMAYNNREPLDKKGIEAEYIMLRLRLEEGLDIEDYERLFERQFKVFFAGPVARLKEAGMAGISGSRFYLTDKGFDLQNSAVLELLNNL